MTLQEENTLLREIIFKLEQRIVEQDKRIAELEAEVRRLSISKNSSNSSKPPSSDMFPPKRSQSLRESNGKKTGGQLGHKGSTLEMSSFPNEVIKLVPEYCNHCGSGLSDVVEEYQSKRQVVDIPPITPIITEYRKYRKCCPNCGNHQETDFPAGVTNNIQYGPGVEAAIAYFSVYQYLPYQRLATCFKDLFNLDISQGTINNILNRMASKAMPVYKYIKERVSESLNIGSDETSVKVTGDKWWIWVWQTPIYTYITSHAKRGSVAIESEFPDGLPNAILSTDRWAAQLKTPALAHQLCTAHLLRDLKYLIELENNQWLTKMNKLIKDALDMKSKCSEYNKNDTQAMQIEQRFDLLLQENIPKETYPKSLIFQKAFVKHRDSIFVFLYNADIQPDNNSSERAIRNVKVKQKVSGQFKTGQQIFCILRSVIDTCIKQSTDIMNSLTQIAHYQTTE